MEPVAKYIPHAQRNAFLDDLHVEPMNDSVNWRVLQTFCYVDPDGQIIEVPAGFVTDFASVPPLARFAVIILLIFLALSQHCPWLWFQYLTVFVFAIAIWVCFVAEWLENSGTDKIATVHDFIYQTRCRPRWKADYILYMGMIARNAPHNPIWKRILFWLNVRLFGLKPWIDDARKVRKAVTDFCGR